MMKNKKKKVPKKSALTYLSSEKGAISSSLQRHDYLLGLKPFTVCALANQVSEGILKKGHLASSFRCLVYQSVMTITLRRRPTLAPSLTTSELIYSKKPPHAIIPTFPTIPNVRLPTPFPSPSYLLHVASHQVHRVDSVHRKKTKTISLEPYYYVVVMRENLYRLGNDPFRPIMLRICQHGCAIPPYAITRNKCKMD